MRFFVFCLTALFLGSSAQGGMIFPRGLERDGVSHDGNVTTFSYENNRGMEGTLTVRQTTIHTPFRGDIVKTVAIYTDNRGNHAALGFFGNHKVFGEGNCHNPLARCDLRSILNGGDCPDQEPQELCPPIVCPPIVCSPPVICIPPTVCNPSPFCPPVVCPPVVYPPTVCPPAAVPEPSSFLLAAIGGIGGMAYRYLRRRA